MKFDPFRVMRQIVLLAVPVICRGAPSVADSLAHTSFGRTAAGESVELYTLQNREGMQVRIATYGGIVTSLTAPDRHGHYSDIVLGYDDLAGYLRASPYFGALIGRYGNRIARGKFVLDGRTYTLSLNDGPNTLHGGKAGFDKVIWKVEQAALTPEGPQLTLSYMSRAGEEGYPGNLSVIAAYTLTEDNALRVEFRATTDRATVVNLTQHAYFNLRGADHPGDILRHVMEIHAARFTPVSNTLIPSGELRSVAGTPFDFRRPIAIGTRINDADEQLRFGKGYDHNWVIDSRGGKLTSDAQVYEPETGRVLEVLSDQPGLQFYSGNFLDGSIRGKSGVVYGLRTGFCLEPQHFPDSPNHPAFPSTELRVGQVYHSTIIYRFSAR